VSVVDAFDFFVGIDYSVHRLPLRMPNLGTLVPSLGMTGKVGRPCSRPTVTVVRASRLIDPSCPGIFAICK